ncbi:MAG: thiamine-phosphate kinase [Candidatus Bipolaricaulota bacterium]
MDISVKVIGESVTMDEKEALKWLRDRMPVGDDCFVLESGKTNLLLTTDMLHQTSDFPDGITSYTIGWRAVAASLSDIAAMGGNPEAVLIAYGAPGFNMEELEEFIAGAETVCKKNGANIVGGDLDRHDELTIVTTALGKGNRPVTRKGATPGELVAVTGDLGRTGAGLEFFEKGEVDRANELFRFEPRIELGVQLAPIASSMMDISDGLARSLHQLSSVNDVGFRITENKVPYNPSIEEIARTDEKKEELGLFTGEDYELLLTTPEENKFELAKIGATVIGEVTEEGVEMVKGRRVIPLEDEGYVH